MKTVVINGLRYSHVKGTGGRCTGCALINTNCRDKYDELPCRVGGIIKRHFKLPLIKVLTK